MKGGERMRFQTERLKLADYKSIHKSMARDFRREEIKPLWLMALLHMRGLYQGFVCREGAGRAGYMLLLTDGKGHTLLDYYVIEPPFRGRGYGSAFFKAVCGTLTGLLLEVEDPDFAADDGDRAVRLRRIDFYSRNGCTMTKMRSEVMGAHYCIMKGPASTLGQEEIRPALNSLYGGMFGSGWVERYVWMQEEGADPGSHTHSFTGHEHSRK